MAAWTNVRTARKARRCERCFGLIQPGERYMEHVISPDHDDIGNIGWWRSAQCSDCARRYGRGQLLDAGRPDAEEGAA